MVEPDPAVVDAVEAELGAAVLDPDAAARCRRSSRSGTSSACTPRCSPPMIELGEDGGHPAVARGVADVVLAGGVVGRVDDELLGLGVVGRGRPQRLHVGAVAGLGHREAAGQLERAMSRAGSARGGCSVPEVQHGAAEQAPLHAGLDQQREVAEGRASRRRRSSRRCRPGRRTRVGIAQRGVALRRPARVAQASTCARCSSIGRSAAGALPGCGEPPADAVADPRVLAVEEGLEPAGVGGGGRGRRAWLFPAIILYNSDMAEPDPLQIGQGCPVPESALPFRSARCWSRSAR